MCMYTYVCVYIMFLGKHICLYIIYNFKFIYKCNISIQLIYFVIWHIFYAIYFYVLYICMYKYVLLKSNSSNWFSDFLCFFGSGPWAQWLTYIKQLFYLWATVSVLSLYLYLQLYLGVKGDKGEVCLQHFQTMWTRNSEFPGSPFPSAGCLTLKYSSQLSLYWFLYWKHYNTKKILQNETFASRKLFREIKPFLML